MKADKCEGVFTYKARYLEWRGVAQTLGYGSIEAMLRDMYEEKKMSDSEIGKRTGFTDVAIRKKRKEFGIPSRPRGGNNNPEGWGRKKRPRKDTEVRGRELRD